MYKRINQNYNQNLCLILKWRNLHCGKFPDQKYQEFKKMIILDERVFSIKQTVIIFLLTILLKMK